MRFSFAVGIVTIGVGVCAGCSAMRSSDDSVGHSSEALSSPVSSQLPGYVHTIGRSRFRIGQRMFLETNTPLLQRWRGSLGAFASDPTNGWSMALLDGDSPTGPYMLDDAAQGLAVKAYFVGAGLPAEQVGGVVSTYSVTGGGAVASTTAAPTLESINSILTRWVYPFIQSRS